MKREEIIRELEDQLHDLTRLHIQHHLEKTEHFQAHKENISRYVRENEIDVRRELSHASANQYRRYFM